MCYLFIADIKEKVAQGRPVLVGTISIENSEKLSHLLDKERIPHQVLNAKFHEKEAQIVAQAGRPGTVTIATNMAGRGTDIILGGSIKPDIDALGESPDPAEVKRLQDQWQKLHEQVVAAGGLHIIGSERHESRRIDNQLRGRSGRQGDPGSSRFYLSMDDNLMRLFGSDKLKNFMKRMGMEDGQPLEHKLVTRAIESAQRKVETRNFDIRKSLLEFDDVANQQRKVIYEERNALLNGEDVSETITNIRIDVFNGVIDQYIEPNSLPESWRIAELEEFLLKEFDVDCPVAKWIEEDSKLVEQDIRDKITERAQELYDIKCKIIGESNQKQLEKGVMLQTIDMLWKEHLAAMDYMRLGIGLQGYAQRNPKNEYKIQSFNLFSKLLENIKYQVIKMLSRVRIQMRPPVEEIVDYGGIPADPDEAVLSDHVQSPESGDDGNAAASAESDSATAKGSKGKRRVKKIGAAAAASATALSATESAVPASPSDATNIGRNDPCPCGSGKKYKDCCGKAN